MLKGGRHFDLAQEAVGPKHRRELGVQHLHGYLPMMAQIAREVDRGHPAAAKLALERVVRPERRLEFGL